MGNLVKHEKVQFFILQFNCSGIATQAYQGICPGITSLCPGIRKCGSLWHFQKYCILRHKMLPIPPTHTRYCRSLCLRVQHSLRDFPFKRLFLQRWCMCVTIIRIFPGSPTKSRPYFLEGDSCNLMYI